MRHFYKSRGRRSRKRLIKPITHIPSAMGNNPAANIAVVFIAGVSARLAGLATTGQVIDENRDREIAVGRSVTTMVATLSVENPVTNAVLEYAWVKVEKADTTPALGTLLPTSSECEGQGTQQALREVQPGQVIKYGVIPITAGANSSRVIKANWAKYRMSACRIGDHFILYVFQRGGSASNKYNIEFFYKTSG